MNIGEKIKYFRQQRNISREVLSNLLKISIHTLSKYEQGQREPSYETLIKICEILNVSINDILEENISLNSKKDSEISIIIVINIKLYREKSNLSQEEFADKIGISRRALINYEKGERTPSIEILYKISIECNIPLRCLLGDLDNTFSIKNFSDNELLEEIQRRLNKRK